MAPLGYDTKDRKITVNKPEAAGVRLIFQRYLELGSLNLLMADLRNRGVVTKQRKLKDGSVVGGIPFTRGPPAHDHGAPDRRQPQTNRGHSCAIAFMSAR